MGRIKVNLTIEAKVAQSARDLGLNMSRLAETAIAEAARQERNRQWREANALALDSYAREVDDEGLPLAGYRSF
jgi:Post-segregation antitoxin (ccd killing mechanism protein) encoded by the F plasmid